MGRLFRSKESLLGNGVFAGVMKVRTEIRSYWVRVGPKSTEHVLKRDRQQHTEPPGKEGHVKTEAEGPPQSREHGSHQELKETRKNSPLESPERMRPYQHLGFGFLASPTVRGHISVGLSHQVLVISHDSLGNLTQGCPAP